MNRTHCDSETLILYAFEELSPREFVAVKDHVAQCPQCLAEVQSLRDSVSLLALLPQDEPSSSSLNAINAAARRAVKKNLLARVRAALNPRWLNPQPSTVALAASIIVVICSFFVIQQFSGLRPYTAEQPQVLKWQDDYASSLSLLQEDMPSKVPELVSRDEAPQRSNYLATVGVRDSEAEFHKTARELDESLEFLLEQAGY